MKFKKFLKENWYWIVPSILLIILLTITLNYVKSRTIKIKDVPYNEFVKLVDEGKVDIVYYNRSNEYMYAGLFNEETIKMSYEERSEYSYSNEDKIRVSYPASETFREDLLAKNVRLEIMTADGNDFLSNSLQLVSTIILYLVLFGVLAKVFMTFMSPVSKIKDDVTDTGKRFSDVIGHDEIIEDIKFITELIKNPKKGKKIGVKAPKGILLEGPPGCGKTLIAQAIAGEAGVPFIRRDASNLIEMYVGVGARRVRDLFKKAKSLAPCVIFIDEFDAIGKPRGSSKNSMENEQTINQLLTEMDGFVATKGIFVIAATNHSDDLDPAVIRAGRFDRRITVNPPKDWHARKEIFEFYLSKYTYDKDMDLDSICKQLVGATGADIEVIVNEASIRAVMKDLDQITYNCITEAIDLKIFKGNYSKDKGNPKDREIVAYHEAGHAIASYLLGEPIARASIQATTSGIGGAVFNEEKNSTFMTKTEIENRVKIMYGGRASEEIKFKDITTGASNDIAQATKLLKDYIKTYGFDSEFGLIDYNNDTIIKQDTEKVLNRLGQLSTDFYKETIALLKENYDKVEIIAKNLLEKDSLSNNEINTLLT